MALFCKRTAQVCCNGTMLDKRQSCIHSRHGKPVVIIKDNLLQFAFLMPDRCQWLLYNMYRQFSQLADLLFSHGNRTIRQQV
ncbi:hypothetical protein D3C80_1420470 [compost metagenome]